MNKLSNTEAEFKKKKRCSQKKRVLIFNMIIQHKFFMFISKNLKETGINYCAQWSGLDNKEIECSII